MVANWMARRDAEAHKFEGPDKQSAGYPEPTER